ncbi:MAG: hypothetical protein K8H86_01080 [Ignavibacteriaceae bacterium]|nr:hypothetical protein [Ignavibacteriaceae bacterium]
MFKYFFTLCVLLFTIALYPQQSKLSKGVNFISSYIASPHYIEMSKRMNDLSLMDSIFITAVKFYDDNYEDALIALTFAAVPYNRVPIKIPLLGIINYPLTSANDSIFLLKNKNLPKYLFFDSPTDEYGDKDKPAHFFGSAFIAYSSHIFDLGDLIGYFVEVFEESFKVQSRIDARDLMTNKFGNIFGEALKSDKTVLPSNVLILQILSYFRYQL